MMKEAEQFKESYLSWLNDKLVASNVGEYIRIDAPFLDRHNDFITLYVKPENGGYLLTDDGFTIGDLLMAGCDLSTPKRKMILSEITNGFGVSVTSDDELTIRANTHDFALKRHMLIQAMLSVDDMFMMSQSHTASVFLEDIALFLSDNDVRYSESIQMPGTSGLSHKIDFLIPASKKAPERLMKGVNSPTMEKIKSILFTWSDIRPLRKAETKFLILYNDTKKVSNDLLAAMKNCEATPIPWSSKYSFVEELVA
ncbi:MAG: DUF1829 domain-containing protein [Firmicutes bacterium]|nr:DUF1829 domain-containing protein [Bacillota bacterium]